MESLRGLMLGAGVCALLASPAIGTVSLPCFSDFDSDTVGMEPTLGGADNPTGYLRSLGTEAAPVVRASSLGLMSQPAEFAVDPDETSSFYLVYDFAPNLETTIMRTEATFSVSDYVRISVMRSWKNGAGLVLGTIGLDDDGDVLGGGETLGQYTPGVPLRVRMDVDIAAGSMALTLDEELNGFGDDVTFDGLSLTSPGADNCGGFGIGYRNSSGNPTGVTVAYDDIVIKEIPGAGVVGLVLVSGPLVVRRRRR